MFDVLERLAPPLFKKSGDRSPPSPSPTPRPWKRWSATSSFDASLSKVFPKNSSVKRSQSPPRWDPPLPPPAISSRNVRGAFELLASASERFLEGTPFKIPIAIFNQVIDLAHRVAENSNSINTLFQTMVHRLDILNRALMQAHSDEALERLTAFSGTLTQELQGFRTLAKRGTTEKIMMSRDDEQTIITIITRLDACLADFQLDVIMSLERSLHNAVQQFKDIQIERWPRSKHATYGADTDPGTTFLQREPCTPNTRVAVMHEISEWAEDPSLPNVHPVFWLTGHAGAGKSTIAFTIAQRYTKKSHLLAGNFFCSRQFEDTRGANYIIPSIAYQLAQHSSSFRQALVTVNALGAVPDTLEDQMSRLLVEPWRECLRQRQFPIPPLLIVIDALDEISDGGGTVFLQHLLEACRRGDLSGLRFLVTSRSDPDVAALCEEFPPDCVCKLQNVGSVNVAEDITTFVRSKLPALGDNALVQELVRQSDGLFIYAATAVRYVKPRRRMTHSEQLALMINFLGPGFKGNSRIQLDTLYRQLLGAAFSGLEKAQFQPRLRVLHAILAIPSAHTAAVIASLDPEFAVELVELVVAELNAVLYVKSDHKIYWYHASFPDFIFDATRSQFSIENAAGTLEPVSMFCGTDARLNWMQRLVGRTSV